MTFQDRLIEIFCYTVDDDLNEGEILDAPCDGLVTWVFDAANQADLAMVKARQPDKPYVDSFSLILGPGIPLVRLKPDDMDKALSHLARSNYLEDAAAFEPY